MRQSLEERRVGKWMTIRITPQHRGEIKAEPVDVKLRDPVVETIENEGADNGMVAVERVAATRVVRVAPVGCEHVVGLVVDPAEGDRRPAQIPLGGMVEDHVEDHRDPGDMERLDQLLELRDLRPVVSRRRVTALRRVEADRAVAPVIAERLAGLGVDSLVLVLVELEDRHQFHAVDPDRLEIRDLLNHPLVGSGMAHPRGGMAGEAPHVHLVDHEVLDGKIDRPVMPPVEVLERHPRPVRVDLLGGGLGEPDIAAADLAREGIKQDLLGIEEMTRLWVVRPLHAEAVF